MKNRTAIRAPCGLFCRRRFQDEVEVLAVAVEEDWAGPLSSPDAATAMTVRAMAPRPPATAQEEAVIWA